MTIEESLPAGPAPTEPHLRRVRMIKSAQEIVLMRHAARTSAETDMGGTVHREDLWLITEERCGPLNDTAHPFIHPPLHPIVIMAHYSSLKDRRILIIGGARGGIDVLFGNAARSPAEAMTRFDRDAPARFWEVDAVGHERLIVANVVGPFLMAHARVEDNMVARGSEGTLQGLLPADMIVPPSLWLAADESADWNVRRFVAKDWNDDLGWQAAAGQSVTDPVALPRIL